MANLIDKLTARIEDYRTTNKNPCKNYKTKEAAEKATARAAQHVGTCFDRAYRKDAPSAEYVVFYIEQWGKWVGCINMSEVLRRPESAGGYLGIEPGFFKY